MTEICSIEMCFVCVARHLWVEIYFSIGVHQSKLANDLARCHDCRHHPISFCTRNPRKCFEQIPGALSTALALPLGIGNQGFLRLAEGFQL